MYRGGREEREAMLVLVMGGFWRWVGVQVLRDGGCEDVLGWRLCLWGEVTGGGECVQGVVAPWAGGR